MNLFIADIVALHHQRVTNDLKGKKLRRMRMIVLTVTVTILTNMT